MNKLLDANYVVEMQRIVDELGDEFYCICRQKGTEGGWNGFWAGDGKGVSFKGGTMKEALDKLYDAKMQ